MWGVDAVRGSGRRNWRRGQGDQEAQVRLGGVEEWQETGEHEQETPHYKPRGELGL